MQLAATSNLMVALYLTKYSDLETRIWRRKNEHFIFVLQSGISARNIQEHDENPSYINFEEYNCNYTMYFTSLNCRIFTDNLRRWSKYRKIKIAW